MQSNDLFQTGLATFNSVRNRLRGATADSLIEYTSVGRVEPNVLIDVRAMNLDCIGDVQQSFLAIFSGYYLQAAALINQIGNVKVLDRLESLNPNRSPTQNILDGNLWALNMNSYENGLPFMADGPKIAARQVRMAMEADAVPAKKDDKKSPPPFSFGKSEMSKAITEMANLSVGKMYEIEVTDGKSSFKVPVNIRLSAQLVGSANLIHILTTGDEDTGAKERYHGWKAGKLAFWKDLIFCTDLIDKHRRDLMKDTTGVLSNVERSALNNNLSTIITGNPSVATASNIAIMTQETADELEMHLEGKLDKFPIRQRMMEKTYIMLIGIIDTDHEILTIYSRGIAMPTRVRLKDLKSSNSKGGPDVSDILKAYMAGAAPSL